MGAAKGIHLFFHMLADKMVYGRDIDGFMTACYHITNQFGTLVEITPENGTNCIGAVWGEREGEMTAAMDKKEHADQMSVQGMWWSFSYPAGPHSVACIKP